MKKTVKQHLAECRIIHNGFYTYIDVPKSIKTVDMIKINCPIHGQFIQRLADHKAGCGCPQCGIINKTRRRPRLPKLNKIHQSKYQYETDVESVSINTKITVRCPDHGKFQIVLKRHLSGIGCPVCSKQTKQLQRNIARIERASYVHCGKYNYPILINEFATLKLNDHINIICPIHGLFKQNFNGHIRGLGCPKCKEQRKEQTCYAKYGVSHHKQLLINSTSLQRLQDRNWLQVELNNQTTTEIAQQLQVDISTLHRYLKQHQIQIPVKYRSTPEKEIAILLDNYDINCNVKINGFELDVLVHGMNIAFEYNGLYWHSSKFKLPMFHTIKSLKCQKLGIELHHIFEHQWLYQRKRCVNYILLCLNSGSIIPSNINKQYSNAIPTSNISILESPLTVKPTNTWYWYDGEVLIGYVSFNDEQINDIGFDCQYSLNLLQLMLNIFVQSHPNLEIHVDMGWPLVYNMLYCITQHTMCMLPQSFEAISYDVYRCYTNVLVS